MYIYNGYWLKVYKYILRTAPRPYLLADALVLPSSDYSKIFSGWQLLVDMAYRRTGG